MVGRSVLYLSNQPRPSSSAQRDERMKLTPWYFVAIAPIAVAGCSGAFMGQCAVLAVTICIFIGTLTLGRQSTHPKGPADVSETKTT